MSKTALLARIVITVGLIGYLSVRIDPMTALSQVSHSDPVMLVIGTLLLAIQPLLGAVRWQLIFASLALRLPLGRLLRWIYVSLLFGQVLPSTVGGDALRVWLARRAGCHLQSAVNSVVLDRIAMFLTLLVLLAIGVPRIGQLIAFSQLVYVVPLLVGGGIVGLILLMMADRLPERLRRYRAIRAIGFLARDSRRLFLTPTFASAVLTLSLASYISLIASIYLFARAFGASATLLEFFVLIPPVLLASTLPISIGGWGSREVAMIAALGIVNIDANTAILSSVWLGIASIIVTLPGVLFYLMNEANFPSPEM